MLFIMSMIEACVLDESLCFPTLRRVNYRIIFRAVRAGIVPTPLKHPPPAALESVSAGELVNW